MLADAHQLSHLPLPALTVTASGHALACNQLFTRVLGWTEEEVATADNVWAILRPQGSPPPDPENSTTQPIADAWYHRQGHNVQLSLWFNRTGNVLTILLQRAGESAPANRQSYLSENESPLSTFVTFAPFGVMLYEIIDEQLILRAVNPESERATGSDLHALLGCTIDQAFPGLAHTELPQRYFAIARHGGRDHWPEVSYDYSSINGIFDVYAFQMGPERMAVTFQEISDRVAMHKHLQKLEKMRALGQLAGGFAHDVNNQLTGIMGYAEMLLIDNLSSRQRQQIQAIEQAAQRAADLAQNLLSFARQRPRQLQMVDLVPLVTDTVDLLQRTSSAGLTISWNPPPPCWVEGDASLLQSAILNLALNARQAMHETGTITITLSWADRDDHPGLDDRQSYLALAIADRGPGMSAEAKERLFEPFFTTRSEEGGTGLGLASVYGTAQAHGGQINLHDRPSGGTVATLLLPHKQPDAEQQPTPQPPTSVLVVDDEPGVREVLRMFVEKIGHPCHSVDNGAAALELLAAQPDIGLVLLDMVMPQMDGATTLAHLRQRWPDLPVLIVSAYSEQSHAQTVQQLGIQGWINKPFTIDTLRSHIETLIGSTAAPTGHQPGC